MGHSTSWHSVLPLSKIEMYILLGFWSCLCIGSGFAGGYLVKDFRNDFQRGAESVHKAYLQGVEREIVDEKGNKKTVTVRAKGRVNEGQ